MPTSRVIVYEKTGRWAAALRRCGDTVGRLLIETRSLEDCREELRSSPASVLALELTSENVEAVLGYVADVHRIHAHAVVLVMTGRDSDTLGWMAREAGAAHVVKSPRQCCSARRLIERHVARFRKPAHGWRERIWERLPWA